MKILLGSGYQMTVQEKDDPQRDPYWLIGDALEAAGHTVIRKAWDWISPTTLMGVDAAIVYSYAVAAFENAWASLGPSPSLRALLRIAGVPNIPDFDQAYVYKQGGWGSHPGIRQDWCCQVDSLPNSCAIIGAPEISPPALPDFTLPRLNINCDALVGACLPWERHIRIKDSLAVSEIAEKLMEYASRQA